MKPMATRTEQDLTRAARFTRPPTACGRPNLDRSILRSTRPHAQCGKPITQENKLLARWQDRPSTRVRPRFECKRLKSDSTSSAAPATPQENVFERHRQTERHAARYGTLKNLSKPNPRENAAKYSAPCSSSRMILLHPSRPNAMLSRRRATAVGRADW